MDTFEFSIEKKELIWGGKSFSAISGGFGKGSLPKGSYTVKVRHVVVNPPDSGYQDALAKNSWFIPIEPDFSTTRRGFGIHPDGSPKGSKGCIGLQGTATGLFWKKWNNTSLGHRPTSLIVK